MENDRNQTGERLGAAGEEGDAMNQAETVQGVYAELERALTQLVSIEQGRVVNTYPVTLDGVLGMARQLNTEIERTTERLAEMYRALSSVTAKVEKIRELMDAQARLR